MTVGLVLAAISLVLVIIMFICNQEEKANKA